MPVSRQLYRFVGIFVVLMVNVSAYQQLKAELDEKGITLVAVSKTKPVEDILALYELGQRDFGENYVQELTEKAARLPTDIRWHFIGHLQSNKVKYIAPIVHLVHGVDSLKLLQEIDRQALRAGRKISCLLQVHIAQEDSKFGFDPIELPAVADAVITTGYTGAVVCGLMGMASFSEDAVLVRREFATLKNCWLQLRETGLPMEVLSMGMSADFRLAMEEGTTMVRIGSLLFGARERHT